MASIRDQAIARIAAEKATKLNNPPATSNIDTTPNVATGNNIQAIADIGGTGNVLPDTISKDSNLYKRLQNTGLNDQQIADMYAKQKGALVKPPNENKQQSKVQTITADNGKVYNVTVNPDWTSSFTSQSPEGGTVTKNTFDEAKKTILDNNKAVVPTASTQTQTKVEPIVDRYQDNDPIRLAAIQTNLDAAAGATPELFYDRAAFNKAFEYDKRSDLQKSVLDNYFNQKQDVSVADYRAGKDNKSIVSSYLDGTLKDIDLTDLYKQDPTRYALVKEQIRKQKTINEANEEVSWVVEWIMKQFGLTPDETTNEKTLLEQYDESMKSTEMTTKLDEMEEYGKKANETKAKIDAMEDSVRSLYEWTDVTWDVLDAIVADRKKALTRDYDSYVNSYDSAKLHYEALKDNAERRYQVARDQEALKRQAITDKLSALGFAYGIAKDTLWTDTTDKNIWKTIDTGTSKKPNILMWNTKTQQYDIPVWGASVWGGTSWGGKIVSWDSTDLTRRLNNIMNWFISDPVWTRLSMTSWIWNISADYEYIMNNLMYKSYKEAKASWVTFGATSEKEWDALKKKSSAINWKAGDQYNIAEASRLITSLWGKPETEIKINSNISSPVLNNTLWSIMNKYWRTTDTKTTPTVPVPKKRAWYEAIWDSIWNIFNDLVD